MNIYDIVIIGGGASGLFAATYAAYRAAESNTTLRIAILERGKRVGRKLMATGNGTCNISHIPAPITAYHGTDVDFARYALTTYPPQKVLSFFQSIGVETICREDGRVYPVCEQASAVLDCLRMELSCFGVEERCETEVTSICKNKNVWGIQTNHGVFSAYSVIVSAGGAASPSLGGCVNGYALLESIGCKRHSLFPTIVPVKTDTTYVRAVKGVRVDATVSFYRNSQPISAQTGEILFTEYGISGPAVMYASRPVGEWELHKKGDMTAHIDLFPRLSIDDLIAKMQERRTLRGRTAEDFLTGLIHKRLGQTLLRVCQIPFTAPLHTITDAQIALIASCAKDWKLTVYGTSGFGAAQATAGGCDTNDFCAETMEHRRHRGMYAIGEVLDIDGDCGGFNLQWAWSSAMTAVEALLTNRGIV